MLAVIGHTEERTEMWRMVSVLSHYSMLPHFDQKHADKIAPEKLVRLPGQKEEKQSVILARVWRDGEPEPND